MVGERGEAPRLKDGRRGLHSQGKTPCGGEARFRVPALQKPDSLQLPEICAVRASELNTRRRIRRGRR